MDATEPRPESRAGGRALADHCPTGPGGSGAVFLLALAVRVVYILEIDASPLFAHPAVDSLTYTQHAERLAAGNWLGRGGGPFWPPPLYPYLLGVLKTLFPGSFFYVVRLVQALLGALIYWLGRQVARPAVAAAAAVATTLWKWGLAFPFGVIAPLPGSGGPTWS